MKKILLLLVLFITTLCNYGQQNNQIITSDLNLFLQIIDEINATTDTAAQRAILQSGYLNKGSVGLSEIMTVRNYTENEYLNAIRNYPLFWASLRPKMEQISTYTTQIQQNIELLKLIYPEMKPATIYFTVGAFRTNGTTIGNHVLMGTEMCLADTSVNISELPEYLHPYYQSNPAAGLGLLCTHEYVHTQQKEMVFNLLSLCMYEGVAEFISSLATGQASATPAIDFGKKNEAAVVNQFIHDLYIMTNDDNWLWGQNHNALKVRDLGYYIGYEISERYYNQAENKQQAIKELIELDYTNDVEVERIINQSKLFPKTITELYNDYEKIRPTIVSVAPFPNNSTNVEPGKYTITVTFSEPLNGYTTSLDLGPLGLAAFPVVSPTRVWSEDKKSWSIEITAEAGKQYQIIFSNNFRTDNDIRLKPYLFEFSTK